MAATTYNSGLPAHMPSFGATLKSEWTKIRTVRATYIQMFLAIGLAAGMAAMIALAVGSTWGELSPEDQAEFDPTFIAFFGTFFSSIVLIVTGVTFVSSEYSSGMVRTTFAVTPQRGRVLLAKALIITGFTLVIGLLATAGAFVMSQLMLANYEDVPTASLSDDDVLRALVANWLTTPAFPLIGAALGSILRNTASAITGTLGLILVPSIFGALLPDVIQENLLRFLPGTASDNVIAIDPDKDATTYMDPVLAGVLLVAWIVAFFAVAYGLLRSRDV